MLLFFRVSNYLSVNKPQILTMSSSKYYKGLEKENSFESGVNGLPRLLRSAVIYGPNAAGKSNLLKAIHFMQSFVLESHAYQEGQKINVQAFAFEAESRDRPSEFEISFVQDGVRYQYGFSLTTERIMEEWLITYPEGKPQRWFQRVYDPEIDRDRWHFGSKFTGRKKLWRDSTRKNALFLSTAIQLNNEQFKPVFNWFQESLTVIPSRAMISLGFSIDACSSEEGKRKVMTFMNSADLSIEDIQVAKIPITDEMIPSILPEELKNKMKKDLQGTLTQIEFQHKDDRGDLISFDIRQESDGTQKFFAIAGPWLDVLARGKVLFVDELDTSLHPLLVRFLVESIHDKDANQRNAQLIFTTHDTSLLDTDLFRRDQIWFAERSQNLATQLYPLSDFSPRQGEALEKSYLKGRYGALPLITDVRR